MSTHQKEISKKLKDLGFVYLEGSGVAGCCTIPCFGGKMPYQREPEVGCAIIKSMCNESPYEQMKEENRDENP